MSMFECTVVICLVLAKQSASLDPQKPWKRDQTEEVRSHLNQDEQNRSVLAPTKQ